MKCVVFKAYARVCPNIICLCHLNFEIASYFDIRISDFGKNGGERTRTAGLCVANALLSHLSYTPIKIGFVCRLRSPFTISVSLIGCERRYGCRWLASTNELQPLILLGLEAGRG